MNNIFYKIILSVLIIAAYSCKKGDITISNPTNGKTLAIFNPDLNYGTLFDIDGNEYKTIKIGNQTWMAENLRASRYNDGSDIDSFANSSVWSGIDRGAYCTYQNISKYDSVATFGYLYNFYAINSGKLAPKGWHVPDFQEWATLMAYLNTNGYNYNGLNSGNKFAKSLVSSNLWQSSTIEGAPGNTNYEEYINKSGFSAVPSGFRNPDGSFEGITTCTAFWSTSQMSEGWFKCIHLSYINPCVEIRGASKNYGLSVRCVKD